uniref:Cytochrome c biogenesis protein CcsA n=1 Tax=Micractinium conductrix TaxID=554055 RepID=A0A2I4S7B0_9CHLO|nr:cytochrome c heme attachment protein [Micractinium conductrix]AST08931.1 cytochrome c heme attachment protein [Micractinium conductrix]
MIVDIPVVERFCANSCFFLLFCTTLYYWAKTIFTENSFYTQTGLLGFSSTVTCLTVHLLLRWFESGHFPLSNLYESLLFLSWCLLILHIYIERSTKILFLGVLTAPAILCLIAFTDFSLPPELQRSGPLVPALQSNWLVMHVTVMIASYAALLLGCLVSIAYLIFSQFLANQTPALVLENQSGRIKAVLNKNELSPLNSPITTIAAQKISKFESESSQLKILKPDKFEKFQKFLVFLDNLSYRNIGIGFCFLTLGILSGAVWANETWGNYWSWDPKETWAFITWLTFACYLHSRLVSGWTGSKPACIASFGFIIVWVCYLGVNLLGKGLHSYGFLQI